MSTPIEIVREYIPKIEYTRTFYGREREEVLTALASVLRDAERFKALERAHDCRSIYAMCVESHDNKARFTGYNVVACTLAELADRLREGTK